MSTSQNIPNVIHYCWFGEKQPSLRSQHCIASWQRVMPNVQIKLHNETNTALDTPLLKYLYTQKSWAFLSDYIRLCVLYESGGIYLDVDIEVIKPFDTLLHHELFLGYESKGRLNSSVLGSIPSHPFLKYAMTYMNQKFLEKKPYQIAPEVMTEIYNQYPEKVTALSEEYFYPYNPYDIHRNVKTLNDIEITENTYAIHHWEKQWKMGWIERIKRKIL